MRAAVAAVGGTFDRLHDGHKALILEAFRLGDKVIIGLTSDAYVKKAGKVGVASYQARRKRLMDFLVSSGLSDRAAVVKIADRFGPTVDDPAIACIVVTEETREAAVQANRLRAKKGLVPMKIHTIGMLVAKDSLPISSSRIRKGEVDEHGNRLSRASG
jgi:pantetheine-phosphate adenylyltransferase